MSKKRVTEGQTIYLLDPDVFDDGYAAWEEDLQDLLKEINHDSQELLEVKVIGNVVARRTEGFEIT